MGALIAVNGERIPLSPTREDYNLLDFFGGVKQGPRGRWSGTRGDDQYE